MDDNWEILRSDKIGDQIRRELLHHLLFFNPEIATPMIEHEYGQLQNKYFVLKPYCGYRPEFYIKPVQSLEKNREKVKSVLLEYGLKYASQSVRNDKDVVLPTIEAHPDDLRYASETIRGDKDIVQIAITNNIDNLSFASIKVLMDCKYMLELITDNPRAYKYVARELTLDKKFVSSAIERNPEVRKYMRKGTCQIY